MTKCYLKRNSNYSKTGKARNEHRSILKGPEFNFPQKYPKTLSRALSQAAETAQSIVFLDDRGEEKSVTYKSLKENAEQVLASLQKMGVQPGKAVVLQLDGLEEFLTSFFLVYTILVSIKLFLSFSSGTDSFNK